MQVQSHWERPFTSSAAQNTTRRQNGGERSTNTSETTQRGEFKWRVTCCLRNTFFSFFFVFLLHTTHGQHIKYPPFESENFPREKISARVKDAKRGQFIYDTTC